jgi:hypothetical protein
MPSNHTVIWILPDAFIVFATDSGAREKMRLRPQKKQIRSARSDQA